MLFTSIAAVAFAGVAAAAPAEEPHQLNKRVQNSDNWTDFFEAYTWIGLGGIADCADNTDLLQAGTGASIEHDGKPSYFSYYQLYGSSDARGNDDMRVSAGDTVYVQLTRNSSSTGTFYWENKTTGLNSTVTISSKPGRTICNTNAEWIHERPGDDSFRPAFPSFTNFAFYSLSTTNGTDGQKMDLWTNTEASDLYHDQTPRRLCSGKFQGLNSISITQDKTFSDLKPKNNNHGHN